MADERSDTVTDAGDASFDTRLIWAVFFFVLAVYAKFPAVDLIVSSRYFDAARGFIHAQDTLVLWLYDWTPPIGRGLALMAGLHAWLAPLIAMGLSAAGHPEAARRCRGPWRHVSIVFLCAALLGPGLIIEGVFKNTVGRPRPVQIEAFGGTATFQGPFARGDNPEAHRSFCSSHAAAGFALMGLVMSRFVTE